MGEAGSERLQTSFASCVHQNCDIKDPPRTSSGPPARVAVAGLRGDVGGGTAHRGAVASSGTRSFPPAFLEFTMTDIASPGARFRACPGGKPPADPDINANHLAKRAGFRAITCPVAVYRPARWACRTWAALTMDDVLTDIRRITDVCDLPLLSDIDTGFGPAPAPSASPARSAR